MVYMLKFDIAHSYSIYHKKELNVRESPTGQVKISVRCFVKISSYIIC
jgi:hypothetical protein